MITNLTKKGKRRPNGPTTRKKAREATDVPRPLQELAEAMAPALKHNIKVGRPTTYDPKYCDEIIAMGAEGKSFATIAVALGTTRTMLYQWAEANPEFADAMRTAHEAAQGWWEELGRYGAVTGLTNVAAWSRSMAARFPQDWRETKRIEQTGADGGAIQVEDKTSGLAEKIMANLQKIASKEHGEG